MLTNNWGGRLEPACTILFTGFIKRTYMLAYVQKSIFDACYARVTPIVCRAYTKNVTIQQPLTTTMELNLSPVHITNEELS